MGTVNTPISQLPPAILPLTGTELVPLDQGGVTVQAQLSAIFGQIPVNNQSGNYQYQASDIGKAVRHPLGAGAGHTYTIPANAVLALPVGTVITGINRDSNTLAVAIGGTDVLTQAGTTNVGSRTIAQNGMFTLFKDSATTWLINGVGVT